MAALLRQSTARRAFSESPIDLRLFRIPISCGTDAHGLATMNIFGAFTFGSLIKTFLPGFVWLIALGIVAVDIAQWRHQESGSGKF
jgi:hypothetical protein